MAQPRCFDITELTPSSAEEDAIEDLSAPDDEDGALLMQTLFPAAQVVRDSPLVAICSRYVLEVARAEVLANTSFGQNAALQALSWRRRCEAKVRDGSACLLSGIYYSVAPPALVSSSDHPYKNHYYCSDSRVRLRLPERPGDAAFLATRGGGAAAYLTPACVVVDRVRRIM